MICKHNQGRSRLAHEMMAFFLKLALILPAILLFNCVLVKAQVQLLNITSASAPGLSATCLAVLNQQVTCNDTIAAVGNSLQGAPVFGIPLFVTSQQLSGLCTTQCSASLATWERRIAGACGATLYNATDGGMYALASYAESYVEAFNSACLKNKAGAYCNAVIGTLLGINPSNQRATATPASNAYCDDCYLSLVSTQLAMPMASTNALKTLFTALTSSCTKTGWTLSNPPNATTFTVPPTTQPPAPSCTGTMYTISSGDTCVGISMNKGISTDDLLSYNSLSSMCDYFPKAGTSLCIPRYRTCQPYTVQKSDTCSTIQSTFKIFYAQLIAWNPSLGPKCSNIQQYVGYVICVSNPGGAYVNPSPTTVSSSTASSLWTYALPAMSSYPNATYQPSTNVAPYANGTRLDCTLYVTAPVLTNYTANQTTSFSCQDASSQYNISMGQFLDWNPSLAALNPCTLANNTQYCIQSHSQVSKNITSYCVRNEVASAGYDCDVFAGTWGIETEQFVLWNPELGRNCENFKVGTAYCIDVLHYKQPGITSNCNKFAVANITDWAELPCQIIETEFGLSHARFLAWNPAVLNNCTGLYLGYDYCVSIPNYRPTYTTTTPFATNLPTTDTGSQSSSLSSLFVNAIQKSDITPVSVQSVTSTSATHHSTITVHRY